MVQPSGDSVLCSILLTECKLASEFLSLDNRSGDGRGDRQMREGRGENQMA